MREPIYAIHIQRMTEDILREKNTSAVIRNYSLASTILVVSIPLLLAGNISSLFKSKKYPIRSILRGTYIGLYYHLKTLGFLLFVTPFIYIDSIKVLVLETDIITELNCGASIEKIREKAPGLKSSSEMEDILRTKLKQLKAAREA